MLESRDAGRERTTPFVHCVFGVRRGFEVTVQVRRPALHRTLRTALGRLLFVRFTVAYLTTTSSISLRLRYFFAAIWTSVGVTAARSADETLSVEASPSKIARPRR